MTKETLDLIDTLQEVFRYDKETAAKKALEYFNTQK